MSRSRKGKPIWQNLWNKKPEDVSIKDFDRWSNLQTKIQDGMQRTIDRLEKEKKQFKE
tara:strand:- start:38 stop:211 length:174 start_codon:yes stop_codon:yes gene_type:complete